MCDKCLILFDTELMNESTKLRLKLKKEEQKLYKLMDKIKALLDSEKNNGWVGHNCTKTRVRVLGSAKIRKLNKQSSLKV